jgi:hypothetical protein
LILVTPAEFPGCGAAFRLAAPCDVLRCAWIRVEHAFASGTIAPSTMSEKSLALMEVDPPAPADDDYDLICATMMATVRGRRFLEEYARRNRAADTHLLLDAIARIEGVVRGERTRQADLALRSDLLAMAQAIAQTRAEVTQIDDDGAPARAPSAAGSAPPLDISAAAERLKDAVWTMRERGLDFTTCAQIEELAGAILSAFTPRDPHDRRTQKLAEVLGYLEARIDAMLDACRPAAAEAQAEAAAEMALAPAALIAVVEHNPPAHAGEAVPTAAPAAAGAIDPVAESEAEPADFLLEALPDVSWSDRPPPQVAPKPQPWPRQPAPASPAEIEAELFAVAGARCKTHRDPCCRR